MSIGATLRLLRYRFGPEAYPEGMTAADLEARARTHPAEVREAAQLTTELFLGGQRPAPDASQTEAAWGEISAHHASVSIHAEYRAPGARMHWRAELSTPQRAYVGEPRETPDDALLALGNVTPGRLRTTLETLNFTFGTNALAHARLRAAVSAALLAATRAQMVNPYGQPALRGPEGAPELPVLLSDLWAALTTTPLAYPGEVARTLDELLSDVLRAVPDQDLAERVIAAQDLLIRSSYARRDA